MNTIVPIAVLINLFFIIIEARSRISSILATPLTISEQRSHVLQNKSDSYQQCGYNKVCVPFYLCNSKTKTVIKDGTNLIDVRINKNSLCPNYLETCCGIENRIAKSLVISAHTNTNKRPKCGKRNTDGILFKITGHRDGETEYGEFPWMIAVLVKKHIVSTTINIYQCGGSLIHPSAVLTAAHCVVRKHAKDLIVRAGEWDTQTMDEFYSEQDNLVKEIAIHEKFSRAGLYNNMALLFTERPFELGPHVATICLPPANYIFDYNNCFANGWGKDSFGQNGKYQVILKKIELLVVPSRRCENIMRTTRLGRYFELHKSFICAGGELGKDTCKGDGGGPLSCPIPGARNHFYQSGLVAWGIGCGDGTPGIYVNVAFLRHWIDEIFDWKGLDRSYYSFEG